MTSRPSRRRDRQTGPPPLAGRSSPTSPGSTNSATLPAPPAKPSPGYGRAALILALLLGTLAERAALSLPIQTLDIFHLVVVIGIALLAARTYRRFARSVIERSRERRRNR